MAKKRATIADAELFQKSEETQLSQHDSKSTNKQKVKNTYYFSPEIAYRLDRMQLEMRHLTGEKLSKSEVIEAALQIALDDFEADGKNSEIVNLLSNI